jgi:hypothetical protein
VTGACGVARGVDVPGYAALILRATLREHYGPEGLITESKSWWLNTGMAEWPGPLRRWVLPSNATAGFGYLEKADAILVVGPHAGRRWPPR